MRRRSPIWQTLMASLGIHAVVILLAGGFIAQPVSLESRAPPSFHWVTVEGSTDRFIPRRRGLNAARPALKAHLDTSEGAPVSAENAPFSANSGYFLEIQRLISRQKAYPRLSAQKREQGVVEVEFQIDERGHISAPRLKKASVHGRLNEAAIDLLLEVGQLPPPPREISSFPVKVSLPISYRLH